MRRREFITLAGGMAVWPLAARAQQQPMPVIGFVALSTVNSKGYEPFLAEIRKGLAEEGYVENHNFRFEFREAKRHFDLVPILFRELVDQKVRVILTGTTAELLAARAATQSIPIVFHVGTDPVENGYVSSLKKPGGNITGIFNLNMMLADKRIQIIHELIPSATKFAYLSDSGDEYVNKLQLPQVQAAADALGVGLLNVNAHTLDELEGAFETAVRGGVGGMVIGANATFYGTDTQLVALADRYRLPTMYMDDAPVSAGGLICYNTDQNAGNRLEGSYVGRILKGEKPTDMPVEQSTKTKMMINLNAAKALGITVPTSLLARADQVIE
jgi:putative ABC transport system substrate-binding protein